MNYHQKHIDTYRPHNNLFTQVICEHNTNNRQTLCHQAASNGNIHALKTYLALGAPLEKKDQFGNTPLAVASLSGHYLCAQTLLRHGANPDARNKTRNTPLLLAVKYRRYPLSKLLLEYNADTHAHNKHKETPLYWAVKNNYPELWQLLSFYQPNQYHTQQTNKTLTPPPVRPYISNLSRTITSKNIVFLQELKHHRQPILDTNGRYRGRQENYNTIMTLLSEGAQLNITDKSVGGQRNSPLHYAVLTRDKILVKTFLELGADYTITNKNNDSPIDLAATCPTILKIFLDCTIASPLALWRALLLKDKKTIKNLINNNPNFLTKTDPSGNSPYHLATLINSPNIMRLLLAFKKYNPTQTNKAGKKALQLAHKLYITTPATKKDLKTSRRRVCALLYKAMENYNEN